MPPTIGPSEADVTPNSLAYVTVATDYVAGGADGGDTSLPTPPGFIPPVFKPENILSYEIGSKNTLLDKRLNLNGDFYYYIIKNYADQQTVRACDPSSSPEVQGLLF